MAACAVCPSLGGGLRRAGRGAPRGCRAVRGPYPTSVMTWEAQAAEPGPGSVGAGGAGLFASLAQALLTPSYVPPRLCWRVSAESPGILCPYQEQPPSHNSGCNLQSLQDKPAEGGPGSHVAGQPPTDGGGEGAAGRRGTRTPTFRPAGVEALTCPHASTWQTWHLPQPQWLAPPGRRCPGLFRSHQMTPKSPFVSGTTLLPTPPLQPVPEPCGRCAPPEQYKIHTPLLCRDLLGCCPRVGDP